MGIHTGVSSMRVTGHKRRDPTNSRARGA